MLQVPRSLVLREEEHRCSSSTKSLLCLMEKQALARGTNMNAGLCLLGNASILKRITMPPQCRVSCGTKCLLVSNLFFSMAITTTHFRKQFFEINSNNYSEHVVASILFPSVIFSRGTPREISIENQSCRKPIAGTHIIERFVWDFLC